FASGEGTLKTPPFLPAGVTVALAAGVGPTQTDAADITESSVAKAVSALEASTGGKVLEIRFVDEKGHERFESVIAKPNAIVYMAVNPVNEDVTKIAVKEVPAWMLIWKLRGYVKSIEKTAVPLIK